MLKHFFLCCFLFLPFGVFTQTDPAADIARARQKLLEAFEQDNRPDVQFWLDSLQKFKGDSYNPLQWDELWLLYFWLENYVPLLMETQQFTAEIEEFNDLKIQPPPDSLFGRLDAQLYAIREVLFSQIRTAFLSEEEQIFLELLLTYLLRLETQEDAAEAYDARLKAFETQFPGSRFKAFLRRRMYNTPPPLPPGKWGLGADILLCHNTWSGQLERSLRAGFGGDFALVYWQNRWNFALRAAVGSQRLQRDVESKGFLWKKNASTNYLGVDLEVGYDVINQPRLRIFPSAGGGFASIHPPEDEDDPNPDYFENFKFRGGELTLALQADVKFNVDDGKTLDSYHGVRVRIGRRWLFLNKNNPYMKGNMFFFAVGYTLFGRPAQYVP